MVIGLAGNPNSGKSTLFNALTRSNQKIGNWPGVTVERKHGKYYADKSIEIIDLPGTYSLNPLTDEEKITVDYIKNTPPDVIINVVDSTNLERNLAFTVQLLETPLPVVLALNMEDELKAGGIELDAAALSQTLNADAVLVSALRRGNIAKLAEKAKEAAGKTRKPFANTGKTEEEKTANRHAFIEANIAKFRKKSESKTKKITEKIDKIILNRYLAFPIFGAAVFVMYYVSIQLVGGFTGEWIADTLFGGLGERIGEGLMNVGAPEWIISLLADGVIAGVGAVLSFAPEIVVLFLFITFLESCGYMARVAVIMDRIFKRLGLSGKAFIPMIVGCGCSVPAVMTARTIEGESERKTSIMMASFAPCSAKLPIFALFAGALFPDNPFVAPSMYFLAIVMLILGGLFLKMFRKKKTADSFIIELPAYRLPLFLNVLKELWDKTKGFLVRAFAIVLPAAIIVWFLQSFNFSFEYGVDIDRSILHAVGSVIAPLFAPLGFGNWQSGIALISGMMAKETMVSTFGVIFGAEGAALDAALAALFTPQAAYAFMAFTLLSPPCIAALAAIRKEIGGRKMFWLTLLFQFSAGYIVAALINLLGSLPPGVAVTAVISAAVALAVFLCVRYLIKNKSKCAAGCDGCEKNCK